MPATPLVASASRPKLRCARLPPAGRATAAEEIPAIRHGVRVRLGVATLRSLCDGDESKPTIAITAENMYKPSCFPSPAHQHVLARSGRRRHERRTKGIAKGRKTLQYSTRKKEHQLFNSHRAVTGASASVPLLASARPAILDSATRRWPLCLKRRVVMNINCIFEHARACSSRCTFHVTRRSHIVSRSIDRIYTQFKANLLSRTVARTCAANST